MDLSRIAEKAKEIIKRAALVARNVQKLFSEGVSIVKEDESPVTAMDYAIQAALAIYLDESIPEIPFRMIAEEDSKLLRSIHSDTQPVVQKFVQEMLQKEVSINTILDSLDKCNYNGDTSNYYWVLDPIDGTKGFISNARFAVGLALLHQGSVVLGVVACVNLPYYHAFPKEVEIDGGCLAVAIHGHGSTLFDLYSDRFRVLSLPSPTPHLYSVVTSKQPCYHSPTIPKLCHRCGLRESILESDSMCKYIVVAAGYACMYYREALQSSYRENVWDHAAASIVLTEAGGVVTDLHGKPLDFGHGRKLSENYGILATLPEMYSTIQTNLQLVLSEN